MTTVSNRDQMIILQRLLKINNHLYYGFVKFKGEKCKKKKTSGAGTRTTTLQKLYVYRSNALTTRLNGLMRVIDYFYNIIIRQYISKINFYHQF